MRSASLNCCHAAARSGIVLPGPKREARNARYGVLYSLVALTWSPSRRFNSTRLLGGEDIY
eukprot:16201406-Heterocapsa_arctica.AAC.1